MWPMRSALSSGMWRWLLQPWRPQWPPMWKCEGNGDASVTGEGCVCGSGGHLSVFLIRGLGSDGVAQVFVELGGNMGSYRGLVEEFNNGFEGLEEVILGIFELVAEGREVLDGLLGEVVSDVSMSSNIYELA